MRIRIHNPGKKIIRSALSLRRYLSSEDKKAPDASSKRADYTRVVQAVKRLGFPDEAAHIIWRVLAAILHLGNMEFVAKVRTDRTVRQAGRHRGRRWACSMQTGGHANKFTSL